MDFAVDVEPGTVVAFPDIACPWAHLAVHRLLATRRPPGVYDDLVSSAAA